MTEPELLKRAAKGDETAFLLLYEQHRDAVFGFAWALTQSTEDSDEVLQDCFLTMVRKAGDFRGNRALRPWLLGITRNLCYRRLKSRDNEQQDLDLAEVPSNAVAIEEYLIQRETTEAVRQAVLSLPLAQRAAFILFELEEMSLADTAAILGIEVNAVKARLHRGREQLRKSLIQLAKGGVNG
jgi:RNA polymerase sigma-70 factor (ECF subfamily)